MISRTTQANWFFVVVLLAAPLLAFAALQVSPEHNIHIAVPFEHFVIVGLTTFVAVLLAFAVIYGAFHLRHTPTFLMGLGFLSIAGIFLVHGLSTPGILLEPNPVTGVSARLSLFVSSIFLAASVARSDSRFSRWVSRNMGLVLVLWSAVLISYAALCLSNPSALRWVPVTSYPLSAVTFTVALVLLGFTARGYWRRYTETQLPVAGALTVTAALLMEAQIIMFFGETWRINWWEYHVLMLIGFLLGVGALLWEFWKTRSLRRVIEGMFHLRSLVDMELEYTEAISVLAAATEAKDPYTLGHTVRVAELACRLGQELGLPPHRLRVLARAGLLHDVGKLGVPDAVLLKNGPLSDEEFAVIKEHPRQGHDILRRVGHLEEEIQIILAHHERMDGKGYPHGLAGEQIPLEARVLSVADVYDALTTNRPYRKAMSEDVALAIIRESKGSHLDPRCVEALERLLAASPVLQP